MSIQAVQVFTCILLILYIPLTIVGYVRFNKNGSWMWLLINPICAILIGVGTYHSLNGYIHWILIPTVLGMVVPHIIQATRGIHLYHSDEAQD